MGQVVQVNCSRNIEILLAQLPVLAVLDGTMRLAWLGSFIGRCGGLASWAGNLAWQTSVAGLAGCLAALVCLVGLASMAAGWLPISSYRYFLGASGPSPGGLPRLSLGLFAFS